MNIKGIVKVELFDNETGKKVYENEGKNYISKLGKEAMRRIQMMTIGSNTAGYNTSCDFSISGSTVHNHATSTFARYLHLTNDSQIEDENETKVTQPTLAWVDLTTPYAGSESNRGNVNEVESMPGLNSVKWVCDYNTNQANGTFQSIYTSEFSTDLNSTAGRLELNRVGIFKELSTSGFFSCATSDENHFYAISNTAGREGLWRINKITKLAEQISTTNPLDSWNIVAISHISGYIYAFLNYGTTVCRYNITLGIWETLTGASFTSLRHMCTDGQYVYVFGNKFLSKIEHATFSRISHVDTGISNTTYMIYSNGFAYIQYSTTTYSIDLNTMQVLNLSSQHPQLQLSGLVLRGQGFNDEIIVYQGSYEKQNTVYMMATIDGIFDQNLTFFSRRRLQEPVTKTDTQAMKITYTFIFEEEVEEPVIP